MIASMKDYPIQPMQRSMRTIGELRAAEAEVDADQLRIKSSNSETDKVSSPHQMFTALFRLSLLVALAGPAQSTGAQVVLIEHERPSGEKFVYQVTESRLQATPVWTPDTQ